MTQIHPFRSLGWKRQDDARLDDWDDWLEAVLPPAPSDWTFLIVGEGLDAASPLFATLRTLDFRVETAAHGEAGAPIARRERTILLATTTWLAARMSGLHLPSPTVRPHGSLVVGMVDTEDRADLLQACRAGADLLLDGSLDAARLLPELLSELAGLAWMPRAPYRILLIDAAPERLERHAARLRAVGCEVCAAENALTALQLLDRCAPEVCVLDPDTASDDNAVLTVLRRGHNAVTGLPIIDWSSLETEIEPSLAISVAGFAPLAPNSPAGRILMRARAGRRCQVHIRREQARLNDIHDLQASRAIARDTDHPATTSAASVHSRHSRLLVAEDNPANQALLRMQIEALGHAVDTAHDGSAALATWKAGRYDLLLTDLNMPRMDGLALARSIRAAEREHGGHLPIIAITAAECPETL